MIDVSSMPSIIPSSRLSCARRHGDERSRRGAPRVQRSPSRRRSSATLIGGALCSYARGELLVSMSNAIEIVGAAMSRSQQRAPHATQIVEHRSHAPRHRATIEGRLGRRRAVSRPRVGVVSVVRPASENAMPRQEESQLRDLRSMLRSIAAGLGSGMPIRAHASMEISSAVGGEASPAHDTADARQRGAHLAASAPPTPAYSTAGRPFNRRRDRSRFTSVARPGERRPVGHDDHTSPRPSPSAFRWLIPRVPRTHA